jgi:hypothetical protein
MPHHIDIPLEKLLLYEDGDLIFDGSDPATYTVLEPDTDTPAAHGWDRELGGAADGHTVTSDADPGL